MFWISRKFTLGLAVLAVSSACQDDEMLGVPMDGAGAYGLLARGRLAVYNGGVDRAAPDTPCQEDARHRQFDFWLGDWNVTAANGAGGSVNQIRPGLDGCLVSESWTPANGIRGRSINAYDRDLGQWHQTWVSSIPGGNLRMGGGLESDTMVLRGKRITPSGFDWYDEYRWYVLPTGQVVQAWKFDSPQQNTHLSGALTYTAAPSVTPAPETQTTNCRPGGPAQNARQLDFLLGEWTVSAEHGPALGTASITSDLSGCLTEESYRTDRGFSATSFFYWDPVSRSFWRTYVDSEGERVELRGTVVDGRLVLTGTEPGPDGRSLQVRVTLEAVADGVVRQEWAVSEDGEVWEPEMALVFTRD
ncbi:MAG TPA: hypothetical protein VFR37_10850 [Longimicrobium sp.]|nr:hypothetical protein [Longimicrobium sp.]